ncbi:HicB_like antitoxin of toxin-antitoxin system [Celeribacter indicus]|nr:HicB_like antitoxin of toxin-antitoxin system [Celeribacter indicus]
MPAAIEALDLYFEDMAEIPGAMSLDAVRETYREDLLEGAYLIQVPLIPRTTKSVRVNLSFDQGLLSAIDSAADRVGLNRSAFLAMAAKEKIRDTEAA